MCIGRDSTTGAQTDRVSDSQPHSFGRFSLYGSQDNPRSMPQPTPTTPAEPITGGQTIALSQRHLTPYENTGEGDLSDGDDEGSLSDGDVEGDLNDSDDEGGLNDGDESDFSDVGLVSVRESECKVELCGVSRQSSFISSVCIRVTYWTNNSNTSGDHVS